MYMNDDDAKAAKEFQDLLGKKPEDFLKEMQPVSKGYPFVFWALLVTQVVVFAAIYLMWKKGTPTHWFLLILPVITILNAWTVERFSKMTQEALNLSRFARGGMTYASAFIRAATEEIKVLKAKLQEKEANVQTH